MLTRIEISGFKSFADFSLDLGPHAVVVGPNAVGKSNLFDAIRFLSQLASGAVVEAVSGLRGLPDELFSFEPGGAPGREIRLASEVLLPGSVTDPWGRAVELKYTRPRYEVVLERRQQNGLDRIQVTHESAEPVLQQDDSWRPYGRRPTAEFKSAFMRYGRRSPFLSTTRDDTDAPVFHIHQDGNAGRKRPATGADATVLSSITSAEFPHLYALREEIRAWRFLHLDPIRMREPSPQFAAETLSSDGSNLATVLARLRTETGTAAQPDGVYAEILADLAHMVEGIRRIHVEPDTQTRTFRVSVEMRDSTVFSSRLVSDGTLRLLALFSFLHDPRFCGTLYMEEPENGIHPQRLRALIARLREHVAQPQAKDAQPDDPLTQIITNSHSPVVLSVLQDRDCEAFFADVVVRAGAGGAQLRRTRIRPVVHSERGDLDAVRAGTTVTSFEVGKYLETVRSAQ